MDDAGEQIDVVPGERDRFTEPQAGVGEGRDQRVVALAGMLALIASGRSLEELASQPAPAQGPEADAETPASPLNAYRLTERERQVLSLLAQGKRNTEIGDTLSIAPATVKRHVEHLYAKLGVHRRTRAATHALATDESHNPPNDWPRMD